MGNCIVVVLTWKGECTGNVVDGNRPARYLSTIFAKFEAIFIICYVLIFVVEISPKFFLKNDFLRFTVL